MKSFWSLFIKIVKQTHLLTHNMFLHTFVEFDLSQGFQTVSTNVLVIRY